ncbi:hypothetical protein EMLAB_17200 [Enterococcus mundtii]|nr:hypothetical protein EMLAB_17200 [Enterococcus mundtii]
MFLTTETSRFALVGPKIRESPRKSSILIVIIIFLSLILLFYKIIFSLNFDILFIVVLFLFDYNMNNETNFIIV